VCRLQVKAAYPDAYGAMSLLIEHKADLNAAHQVLLLQ
jgi:hypothetical protein